MLTSSNSDAVLLPLLTNLQKAVEAAERRKAEENTDTNLPPRCVAQAKAIRQAIVEWLAESGPATAAEVAEHFGYHKTTAHSYLNRIVHDKQARVVNKRNLRVFTVDES